LVLRQQLPGEDESPLNKMAGLLFALMVLGFVCVLGVFLIRSFYLLIVSYAVYEVLKTTEIFPGMWICMVLLLSSLFGVFVYSSLKNQSRFCKWGDVLIGIGLIACSILLMMSPLLLSLLGIFRGRLLPIELLLPIWERILVSLALLGVGGFVLWNKGQRSSLLKQIRVAWILVAGFLFGIICSVILCSGDGSTASATHSRLFNYGAFAEFSLINSNALHVSSRSVIRELGIFFWLYLTQNYLLSWYLGLLILTLRFQRTSRYLWASLASFATGLSFMLFSAVRYYSEQYWIYVDFFFLGAMAFLVFGFIEGFKSFWIRIATVVLIAVLYVTQYGEVAKTYPHYNFRFRDHIDRAAYGIYEVRDYSALMKKQYGDDRQFIRRVLSDPNLNGSDRGIDLFSKGGVKSVLESSPELKVEFEARLSRK
jgi:hypothetical protein